MTTPAIAPPPGYIWIDNLGDPALVRVELIATVYRDGGTCVVLNGVRNADGSPFKIHANDDVVSIGAAIAAAEAA